MNPLRLFKSKPRDTGTSSHEEVKSPIIISTDGKTKINQLAEETGKKVNELNNTILELSEKINADIKTVTSLEGKISSLKQEKAAAQQQVTAFEEEQKDANNVGSRNSWISKPLTSQLPAKLPEELEKDIANLNSELDPLKNNIEQNQAQSDKTKKEVFDTYQEIAKQIEKRFGSEDDFSAIEHLANDSSSLETFAGLVALASGCNENESSNPTTDKIVNLYQKKIEERTPERELDNLYHRAQNMGIFRKTALRLLDSQLLGSKAFSDKKALQIARQALKSARKAEKAASSESPKITPSERWQQLAQKLEQKEVETIKQNQQAKKNEAKKAAKKKENNLPKKKKKAAKEQDAWLQGLQVTQASADIDPDVAAAITQMKKNS